MTNILERILNFFSLKNVGSSAMKLCRFYENMSNSELFFFGGGT